MWHIVHFEKITFVAFSLLFPFHTVYFMPLSITELECVARLEDGRDGAAPVIHCESHGPLDHLQDQIISPALDSQQQTRDVSRLDLHRNVKVQADAVLFERMDEPALGT